MQIKIIKRFIYNKITSLNNHCNVIDVLNLLDDYIIELDNKLLTSSSERMTIAQKQLKKSTFELIQTIENLTEKRIISYTMTPYKISNLIKLIDKIKGEKEEKDTIIKISPSLEKIEYIYNNIT
jgi:hypothetical protein